MESARGSLALARQGAVSQPGRIDAGEAWDFLDASERDDAVIWRFEARHTCWERKLLVVEITLREVLMRLEIKGVGTIDRASYFAGFPDDLRTEPKATFGNLKWARPAWHRHWLGSKRTFESVFNPQPLEPGKQRLDSNLSQRITCSTTFGPEIFNTFFAPPMYAYVLDEAFTIGVASPVGDSRYNHFDYTATSGWGMELNFDGQTAVDGEWISPALRIAVCDEADSGLADYVDYLRRTGLAPAPAQDIPSWAFLPMVCGWGQQTAWANQSAQGAHLPIASPITSGAGGFASQAAYEEIVRLLEERDLPYGSLTIDMGWSSCLTLPSPNLQKWPDLKGFIERLHRKGKRVFLWLAAWNPGGLDKALCMPHNPGVQDCCDPANPIFRQQLAEAVAKCVSAEGLNADGFKLDFTGDTPRGAAYHPTGNLWGLDLLHDYVKLIHDSMKAAKADTVLETHCMNPQFADSTEMLRLNDIFCPREDVRPSMEFRSRMASIALPGYPIDTDNDPFISRAAWMDYMRAQPSLGLPSLYTLTHLSFRTEGAEAEAIPAKDWNEIRQIWNDYRSRKGI